VNLGLCNLGCPAGAKQSTLLTHVPRAERAGAQILAPVRADRIRVESGSARGIDGTWLDPASREPTGRLRIDAPIVCVAAGVLETAPLLLRSGIAGRGDRVGRGLQFHSCVHVTARFDEFIHGYYGPTMAYSVSEFSDVNGHRGPGFLIESTSAHPIITASALPGFGVDHGQRMASLSHLARGLVLLRDHARGRVALDGDGKASFSYAPGAGDLERLRVAIREAALAYLRSGAKEVYLPINALAPIRREADLAPLGTLDLTPTHFGLLYAVHLFGGASMADTPERGFCDVHGACFDVAGLYVCDAACLPSNTGVNPQVTIVANALRIAEQVAAAARGFA
jgi:choline dehydrogenase-like flavoprotein